MPRLTSTANLLVVGRRDPGQEVILGCHNQMLAVVSLVTEGDFRPVKLVRPVQTPKP